MAKSDKKSGPKRERPAQKRSISLAVARFSFNFFLAAGLLYFLFQGVLQKSGPETAAREAAAATEEAAPKSAGRADAAKPSAAKAEASRAIRGAEVEFAGDKYVYVAFPLPDHTLRLVWRDEYKVNYFNPAALSARYKARGLSIVFATNAGIFAPDFAPLGLHVEDGRLLKPIDRRSGAGNFYLKPNGVFYLAKDGMAKVVESSAFRADPSALRLATQSGPMLVIDGKLHPKFTKGSPNKYIRSGVGVCAEGRLVFAISKTPVRFYDFASLFKDHFRCENALYLDGAISKFYAPALGLSDGEGRFAGILVATKPLAETGRDKPAAE
ncbi:MAG: phosphodiester glycosidase family protein [Neomegalonema sp.]|nr:phosphodiester glycosidase family protein [Neomegalonema sp.]